MSEKRPLNPDELTPEKLEELRLLEPPAPTAWPSETAHVSCVMPTTSKRRDFIARSIRCWMKQSWPNRDLLVVHDGPGSVEDIVLPYAEQDRRIQYTHLDGDRLLGTKYNEGIELAQGEYIALWADDDWNHPNRLKAVLTAMMLDRCQVGGTTTMLAYHVPSKRAFLYWSTPFRPYLVSGTMIFARKLWEEAPFPNVQAASDTAFTNQLLTPDGATWRRWAVVNDPRLYCAFVHGNNTGTPLGRLVNVDRPAAPFKTEVNEEGELVEAQTAWTPLDGEEADMKWHLGDDAEAFGF